MSCFRLIKKRTTFISLKTLITCTKNIPVCYPGSGGLIFVGQIKKNQLVPFLRGSQRRRTYLMIESRDQNFTSTTWFTRLTWSYWIPQITDISSIHQPQPLPVSLLIFSPPLVLCLLRLLDSTCRVHAETLIGLRLGWGLAAGLGGLATVRVGRLGNTACDLMTKRGRGKRACQLESPHSRDQNDTAKSTIRLSHPFSDSDKICPTRFSPVWDARECRVKSRDRKNWGPLCKSRDA